MYAYIGRRVVQGLITLFIITIICFPLTRLSADPMAQYANRPGLTQEDKERIRHNLGLDQPMPVSIRQVAWLGPAGRIGQLLFLTPAGIHHDRPAPADDADPEITAEIFVVSFALLLGTVSAVRQYSWLDNWPGSRPARKKNSQFFNPMKFKVTGNGEPLVLVHGALTESAHVAYHRAISRREPSESSALRKDISLRGSRETASPLAMRLTPGTWSRSSKRK